eukprot:Lankesteria_metandrocarpae@DN2379_c0_g1_i1.p1
MLRRVLNERELTELGLSGSTDQPAPSEVLTFQNFLLIRRFCVGSFISFWSLIAVFTTRYHASSSNVISPPSSFHWIFSLYLLISISFEVLIAFSISNSPWEAWDVFALAVGFLSRISLYVDALFVVQTAKLSSMLFLFSGTLFFCGVVVVNGLTQFRIVLSLFSKRDKFALHEPHKVWRIYAVSQLVSDALGCSETSHEHQPETHSIHRDTVEGLEAQCNEPVSSVHDTTTTTTQNCHVVQSVNVTSAIRPVRRIYSISYEVLLLIAQMRVTGPVLIEKFVACSILSASVAVHSMKRALTICSRGLQFVVSRTFLSTLRIGSISGDTVLHDSPLITSHYPPEDPTHDPATTGTQMHIFANHKMRIANPSAVVDQTVDIVQSKQHLESPSAATTEHDQAQSTAMSTFNGRWWSNAGAKRRLDVHTSFSCIEVGHVKILQTLNMNYSLDLLFLQSTLARSHLHADSVEAHEFSSALLSLSRCFCEDVLQIIIKVYAISTLGISPFLVWACMLSIVEPLMHCLFNTIDATPLEELFAFD